jgi:integrase
MKRNLTDTFLRTLRAPADRLEVNDAACRGLALRVTASDVRTWCYRYTNAAGTVSRLTIGRYPEIGLADARLRADALRRDLSNGVDPVVAQRQRKTEARSKSKSFAHLVERYVEEYVRRECRPRTIEEYERNLTKHVLPHWADRNFDAITRADVVELVNRIARQAPIAASRVATLVGQVFNFAIDVGVLMSSPAVRIRKPGKDVPRERVLTDDEIRLFWPGIIQSPVSRPVGLALRAALLLGLRAGEIAGLRRDELRDFDDQEQAVIELKGSRTKNGRALRLPLSRLAHATLAEACELSTDDTFVFPSIGTAIEAHALAKAMARFGEELTGPQAKTWKAERPTPHDLRRTCRTRLSSLGVPSEVCDQILNHSPQDIGNKVYNQHSYADEKRRALDAWSGLVERILDPKPSVVTFKRGTR